MSNDNKSQRTYYTPERVATARANIARYNWAADLKEQAITDAEAFLSPGLCELWDRVTGQAIPRAGAAGDGTQRERWKPVEGREWKVTNGEYTLPTNDFAAYRENARDDRGFFDPALADDSLLVNEEHPEMGEKWGVDDGFGWVDENGTIDSPGTVFVPVALYNHWYRWYYLWDGLEALRDAYLYTDEERFARAAVVLLDRIADAYPEMDIGAYDPDRFWNSHGGTGQGKIVGSIWETNLVRTLVNTYDAVFPITDDPAIVSFLSGRTEHYVGLEEKDSDKAVRENIERGIVREVCPGVKNAQIRGNLGMHQAALAMAAVVQDDPDGYTESTLEFLFQPGTLETVDGVPFTDLDPDTEPFYDRTWRVTGGDLSSALINRLDRDGYGDESAPNYNLIVRRQLARIAEILTHYDASDEYDLYSHPKFQQAMRTHYPMLLLDRYMPSIGDSGLTGNPERKLSIESAVRAFEVYGDPIYAQVAHLLNGTTTDGLHGDVFSSNASLVEDIQAVIDQHDTYDPESVIEPAYGFSVLRNGSKAARRAVWLYFGRNSSETGTSHAHRDTLNLGVCAHGLALAPDLGYPEQTGAWPKRHNWTNNTISHNTVIVNCESQHPSRVGIPLLFEGTPLASVADIAAPQVYPQTDEYRRTTAFIPIDEAASYAIDVFRVAGGNDHCYSFHGAEGAVTTNGLTLSAASGTYAGTDVPFPDHGEDTPYNRSVGNGFNYLRGIKRDDAPGDSFSVDWDCVDTWDAHADDDDIHLRLTMLGNFDSVALAEGEPPRREENPDSLRYLLARRQGNDLRSAFTAIIEPYCDNRRVVAIDLAPVEVQGNATVRAVRVELDTGRIDYAVSTDSHHTVCTVDDRVRIKGAFALYSERNGRPVSAMLANGTRLECLQSSETLVDRNNPTALMGHVVDFTRTLNATNRIVIAPETETDLAALPGRYLHIDTDSDGNGVYEIHDATREEDRIVLDVGNTTTIRRFVNRSEPTSDSTNGNEIEYVISSGASARVPVCEIWRC